MTPSTVGPVVDLGNILFNTHSSSEPPRVQQNSALPVGFPSSLKTDLAWSGQQFNNDQSYIFRLSPRDISEIEAALRHFKSKFLSQFLNCGIETSAVLPLLVSM